MKVPSRKNAKKDDTVKKYMNQAKKILQKRKTQEILTLASHLAT